MLNRRQILTRLFITASIVVSVVAGALMLRLNEDFSRWIPKPEQLLKPDAGLDKNQAGAVSVIGSKHTAENESCPPLAKQLPKPAGTAPIPGITIQTQKPQETEHEGDVVPQVSKVTSTVASVVSSESTIAEKSKQPPSTTGDNVDERAGAKSKPAAKSSAPTPSKVAPTKRANEPVMDEQSEIPDTEELKKYLRDPPIEQGYYSDICYDVSNKRFVTENASVYEGIRKEYGGSPAFLAMAEPGYTKAASRKVKKVPGLYLYTDHLRNDQNGAHHVFYLLPLLAAINRARSHRNGMKLPPTTILWKNSTLSEKHARGLNTEVKLTNYFLSETHGLESLVTHYSDSKVADLFCFEKMQMVMHDFNLLRVEDFTYLRQLISKRGKTKRNLFEHCKDVKLRKPVVWILSRRVYSRKWINLPELISAVQATFGGANNVDIKVFDSPNLPCKNRHMGFPFCNESDPSSYAEGQQGYLDPSYPFKDPLDGAIHDGNDRLQSVDWDIALFNQATFFLSVHGAALANSIYQPRRSVVFEIMPYGIMDDSYPRIFRSMDVSHVRYKERDDSEVRAEFGRRMDFKDIWNAQNRGRVKALGVRVNTTALEPYLRHAKNLWVRDCKN